jgi:hypothetical protein
MKLSKEDTNTLRSALETHIETLTAMLPRLRYMGKDLYQRFEEEIERCWALRKRLEE